MNSKASLEAGSPHGALANRFPRMLRGLAFGVAASFAALSSVGADELAAMEAGSIDIGRFHGVVYYTAETDGYRVVATIADDAAGSPLRFSATLVENQSATLSVAGNPGEPDQSLNIRRSGNMIVIGQEDAASGDVDSYGTQRVTQVRYSAN